MNEAHWRALAERWEVLRKAGKVWWTEGMLPLGEYRVAFLREDDVWTLGVFDTFSEPSFERVRSPAVDLRDPATLGILLSQWREACGNQGACTELIAGEGWITHWRAYSGNGDAPFGMGATEAEAIIAALEAL